MHKIMRLIHDVNPYDNFPYHNFKLDLQGWGGNLPVFREFIDRFQPELIIEVGTWKGQSTINMATYIKEQNLDTKIIAIDTWLGAEEHWSVAEYKKSLSLHYGYPQLYYQFMANVVHKGVQDIIVPFPVPSVIHYCPVIFY